MSPLPGCVTRRSISLCITAALSMLAVVGCAAVGSPTGADGGISSESVHSAAHGYLEEGELVSPFDDSLPLISQLDPALRDAVRAAATAAEADDYDIRIASGWRSADYQQSLLDDAIVEYGSEDEALRWVSTPEASEHVKGNAVDVGPTDASDWMSRFGDEFGLCQIYSNEMWHYELATTPGGECPEKRTDASG